MQLNEPNSGYYRGFRGILRVRQSVGGGTEILKKCAPRAVGAFVERELQSRLRVQEVTDYLFRRIEQRRAEVHFDNGIGAQEVQECAIWDAAGNALHRHGVEPEL